MDSVPEVRLVVVEGPFERPAVAVGVRVVMQFAAGGAGAGDGPGGDVGEDFAFCPFYYPVQLVGAEVRQAGVPDLRGTLLPSRLCLRAEACGRSDADLAAGGEVGAVPAAARVLASDADFGQRSADLDDVRSFRCVRSAFAWLVLQSFCIHRAAVAEAGEDVGQFLGDATEVAGVSPVGGFLRLVLLVLLQAAGDALQKVLALGVAFRVAGGGGLLGGLGCALHRTHTSLRWRGKARE